MTFTPLPDLGSTDWYGWATDLETEVSKVAGKADASAAVLKWAASTAVTAGELRVAPDGKTIQRNADGTTRGTYDTTEQAAWTAIPATLNEANALPAISLLPGGGLRLNSWTFPAWGYGGNGADKNSLSPTLLDLADLGVPRMLWLPGTTGNFLSTPDNAGFSGNSAGVPQVLTLQADIVTNEWDPVTGQSNYYLVAKPNCWILRLTETGFVEARAFDATGGITLTSTATFGTKQHMYVQAIITPNDGGAVRVDFNTSSDGGTTWDQLGDPVFGPRALGAYATTSGSANGILVGGNTTGSLFRGGIVSVQVYVGSTLAGEVRPASWTAGGSGGTDTAGNVWTINTPQASNWVTATSIAVGGGEYLTLTGSPAGTQLTTAGLYTSLTLSGFSWNLSNTLALAAYRDFNTVINLSQTPLLAAWADLYLDAAGALVTRSSAGVVTQIGV